MSVQALIDVWPVLVGLVVIAYPAVTSHVRVKDLLSSNSLEKREERIRRAALDGKLLEDLRIELNGLGKAMRKAHDECREDVAAIRLKINGKSEKQK